MSETARQRNERWKLAEVLREFPGMALRPSSGVAVTVAGLFEFVAEAEGREPIADSYEIEAGIPVTFPRSLPIVRETGSRIPASFHTNSDGELCLGSPLRLHLEIADDPTLPSFFHRCVIPYLYGFSYQEKHGVLPFGELAHGVDGILADLHQLFEMDDEACVEMLRLGALRKRDANRELCPCGSGRRVGKCHHLQLNLLRRRLGRPFLRDQANLFKAINVRRRIDSY